MTNDDSKIIPFPGQEPEGSLVLLAELVMAPYPIWRRIRLSDRSTFWDLHVAIQDAMGWSHRHRHLFTADHPLDGQRIRLGIPEPTTFHGRDAVMPGWHVRILEIARLHHPPFLYTYHLGEEWQHEVSLESVQPAPAREASPACLDGAGTCPPEGVGGPQAFTALWRESGESMPPEFPSHPFACEDVVFCDAGQLLRELHDHE